LIKGSIIYGDDVEQVVFLGKNTFHLMEHRITYPDQDGFSNILCGEPWFLGLLKKEKPTSSIENWRIMDNPIMINGKRTLIVLADIDSVNKNVSFLDSFLADNKGKMDFFQTENSSLNIQIGLYKDFIKKYNLETTWQEYLLNALELFRVAKQKIEKAPSETQPSVGIAVEAPSKK